MTATRLVSCVAVLLAATASAQGTVLSSKHNLSVTGPGTVRAVTETQVCVFCHVGHGNAPMGQNRPESSALYRPYESSTMKSAPSFGPTGASRLCLSCHDGTIAMGETLASGTIQLSGADPSGRMPVGPANLGTDLRKTHPVSFRPQPSETQRPLDGEKQVKLDRAGQMQCTSCHDPHREDVDPVRKKFLVKQSRFSELCLTCHAVPGWQSNPSSHQSSQRRLPPKVAEDYPFLTVAENGCDSCHRSHEAGEQGRLLRAKPTEKDEQLCLDCHDGFVARTDIASVVARPFAHLDSPEGERVHDAAERPQSHRFQLPERSPAKPRHATCVDCHNPHAAFKGEARAPNIKPANAGAWGVDLTGEAVVPARYEYELCFKCHADSLNQPQTRGVPRIGVPRRAVIEPNLRLQLAPESPSTHGITQPGRGLDVPSLLPPYTTASLLYCTDCHASDNGPGVGGQGPRGPHGSSHAYILERNLSTVDFTPESPDSYALCYKCHDREVLLSDRSAFPTHRQHVVNSATPCTACHVSHGIAPLQGNATNNAHLVDFDVAIVKPSPRGERRYTSLGRRQGTCTVTCHGREHQDTPYTPVP